MYGLYAHLYSESEAGIVRKHSSLDTVASLGKLYTSTVNRYGNVDGPGVSDLENIDAAASLTDPETGDHYSEDQLRHLGYIE